MSGGARRPAGPASPDRLVARADELDALLELIGRASIRLVTIAGVPGVGKTRLALELADRVRRLGTVSVVVPLATVTHASDIPTAIWAAGKSGQTGADAATVEVSAPSVLVLDNVEHLPAAARMIVDLLTDSPDLTIVATSTAPLALAGEQVFRLAPLAHRGVTEIDQAAQFDEASVVLFAERAAAADASFALTDENVADVARLCEFLGGLPLAIELAAARVATFGPRLMLNELQAAGGLDLLRSTAEHRPARHRAIRDSLAWTFALLPPTAAGLLTRLSVFAGSFSLAGVVAVGELAEGQAFDALSTLVDARLVEPDHVLDRYRLMPLVRLFGRDQLGAAERRSEAYVAYVLEFAGTAGTAFERGDLTEALGTLEPEWAEITAVLELLEEQGRAADGLRLAVDCAPFLLAVGFDETARERLERLIDRAGRRDDADQPTLARALSWSVLLARQTPDPSVHGPWAAPRLRAARELAHALDDDAAELLALEITSICLSVTRDLPSTIEAIEAGMELAARVGDEARLARFEAGASMAAQQRGDLDATRRYGIQALLRGQRRGDAKAILLAAMALSGVPGPDDEHISLPSTAELLELARGSGERLTESYLLAVDAGQLAAGGDRRGAAARCAQHLTLLRRLGGIRTFGPALTASTLVRVAADNGEWTAAARLHGTIARSEAVLPAVKTPEQYAAYRAAVDGAAKALGHGAFSDAVNEGAQLSPELAVQAAIDYARVVAAAPPAPPATARPVIRAQPTPELTPRERDVLQQLAGGATNKAIAAELGLSPKTVMHYTGSLYRKIEVRGRADAVAWAYRNGVIQ